MRKRNHKHLPTATIVKKLPDIVGQIDEKFIRMYGRMFYLRFRVYKEYEVLVVSEYLEHVDTATYYERKDSSRMNVFEILSDF
jgi:hypothetical protein